MTSRTCDAISSAVVDVSRGIENGTLRTRFAPRIKGGKQSIGLPVNPKPISAPMAGTVREWREQQKAAPGESAADRLAGAIEIA